MKTLSEQLHELAGRAQHVEDVAAAVAAKNRAALDTQREQLKAKLEEGKVKAKSEAAAAKQETQAWWNKVRSDINDRLTEMRAKRDEHRAEHDIRHAEQNCALQAGHRPAVKGFSAAAGGDHRGQCPSTAVWPRQHARSCRKLDARNSLALRWLPRLDSNPMGTSGCCRQARSEAARGVRARAASSWPPPQASPSIAAAVG
jgi:hypothetical protein